MLQPIHRPRAACKFLGMGLTSLYEQVLLGRLAPPVPLNKRATGFFESDLLKWQQDRLAERDANIAAHHGPDASIQRAVKARREKQADRKAAAAPTAGVSS